MKFIKIKPIDFLNQYWGNESVEELVIEDLSHIEAYEDFNSFLDDRYAEREKLVGNGKEIIAIVDLKRKEFISFNYENFDDEDREEIQNWFDLKLENYFEAKRNEISFQGSEVWL